MRLVGSEAAYFTGVDATGSYMDEVTEFSIAEGHLKSILDNQCPDYLEGAMEWVERSGHGISVLSLPFGRSNETGVKSIIMALWPCPKTKPLQRVNPTGPNKEIHTFAKHY